jgi:hypothetical protein
LRHAFDACASDGPCLQYKNQKQRMARTWREWEAASHGQFFGRVSYIRSSIRIPPKKKFILAPSFIIQNLNFSLTHCRADLQTLHSLHFSGHATVTNCAAVLLGAAVCIKLGSIQFGQ